LDLTAFEQVLGPEHVVRQEDTLREHSTATFATTSRVPAILRPADTAQVQECLRLAQRLSIRVHPISRGHNWGYGSSVPFADQTLLLDLSRMNRILDYDAELGYVVIEPGVTQQQLYDFLQSQGGRFWMDATGSSPQCSVLGNTLERGFGHTPLSDHFSNSCCYEAVLANGERIETGLSGATQSSAKHVYRYGVGPFLDGLFSQSAFGVVTRMTVWLMPAPEDFCAFFFRCQDHEQLPPLIAALRDLRMSGVTQSSVHVVNDYRVLSGIGQYPWTETGGSTPLTPDVMRKLRLRDGFGAWNGSGALYGAKSLVNRSRILVQQALGPTVSSLDFASDRRVALAKRFSKWLSPIVGMNLERTLKLIEPSIALLKGQPSYHAMRSVYWRKRDVDSASIAVEDIDPDRDHCGLLWSAPVCPAKGAEALRLAELVSNTLIAGGFEPLISFTLASPRVLIGVISIIFDRNVPGEDKRALSVNQQLQANLNAAGFPPYRLGVQSMYNHEYHYQSPILEGLEMVFDPKRCLSPGHYSTSGQSKAN
jgi:4-cresol dehydrogenase (hydroxylating) flavoprotein subunit